MYIFHLNLIYLVLTCLIRFFSTLNTLILNTQWLVHNDNPLTSIKKNASIVLNRKPCWDLLLFQRRGHSDNPLPSGFLQLYPKLYVPPYRKFLMEQASGPYSAKLFIFVSTKFERDTRKYDTSNKWDLHTLHVYCEMDEDDIVLWMFMERASCWSGWLE